VFVFKFIYTLILSGQTSEHMSHSDTALAGCSLVPHKGGEKYTAAVFHAMKAYRSGVVAPLILKLRTRWR
jgi:hypothetical protein